MKKSIKIVLLCVLGLVIVTGVCVWLQFGSLVQGAMSCEKLDDGMYYMEYKGDDGFKELMARGGCNDVSVLASYVMEFLSKGYFKPDSLDVPVKPVGCSTLTVKTPEDGVMMARNFDYPYGTALIMHTIPDEGYESITTFSTDFFGFGENYKPEDAVIYAIALDNPQSVAPEMCRYDICLHTPNIKNVETDNQVKRRVITSGNYVVFKIEHTAKAVADFWTSFPTDMAKSEYKMDFSRPIMERYSIVMVKHGCCEMCVPNYVDKFCNENERDIICTT